MSGETEAVHEVKMSGGVLITAGVVTLIVGVVAIFWPDITLLALAILAGINLFIFGIVAVVESFSGEQGSRMLTAILGLLALIGGIVLIRRPGESIVAFVLILGVWFVVSAVVQFVRGIFESEGRGVRLVVALVEFIFGVLILALPKLSLGTLAVLTGIAFAIRGVGLIASGLELRRAGKAIESDLTAGGGPTPAPAA
jgi:uncharacterized membrane protein HdeD (DUF308 family)